MTSHSRYAPSSAHRWLQCPGSLSAIEVMPEEPDTEAAIEGTTAHAIAADRLLGQETKLSPDESMLRHVDAYIQYVKDMETETSTLLVEERVTFNSLIQGGFGTIDALIADPHSKACHVIDFKYGYVPVKAIENAQLRLYAAGAVETFRDLIHPRKDFQFYLHVFQPRGRHAELECLSFEDLSTWVKKIAPALRAAEQPDAPRRPSPDACRYCPAKIHCPEFREHVDKIVRSDFDAVAVSDAVVLDHYQWRDAVEGYFMSLEKRMVQSLLDGREEFAGAYRLGESRTQRRWGPGAERKLVMILGRERAYEPRLIGIPRAQKILGKKFVEMEAEIEKPVGHPTLVKQ